MSRFLRYALGTAVAWVVLVSVLPPERTAPLRALAAGAFAVALLGSRRALSVQPRPEHPRPPLAADMGPPPEQLVRLARIETALRFATESRQQYDRSTRPLLRDLVAGRLVANHGIDPAAHPAAARQAMGEELWQLFVGSPGDPPAHGEVEHLVTLAERL